MRVSWFFLDTFLGRVYAAVGEKGLIAVSIPENTLDDFVAMVKSRAPKAELINLAPEECPAGRQLREYFAGERRNFDLEYDLGGLSDFRQKALKLCAAIPFGRTRTYGQLAQALGGAGAARAIGGAMHNNPISLVIP